MKTKLPTKEYIQQKLASIQQERTALIAANDINFVLEKFGAARLKDSINPNGFGSAIYQQLNNNSLNFENILEYIYTEELGEKICEFVQMKFGNYALIEHFQQLFR